MNTSLDCIPCLIRQTLEAARIVSDDPDVHKQILREVLQWVEKMDFDQSPPAIAQRIHRRLREITCVVDPYRKVKDQQNRLALRLLPILRARIQSSDAPLLTAARIACAGNMIDLGVNGNISEADVHQVLQRALSEPFWGEEELFLERVTNAKSILYLADNAGEIVFDRLLIEQLSPNRVTLVVRGAPIINDATLLDAQTAGLDGIIEIIDNGSDAPGTILNDCSPDFRHRFAEADFVLAKGQGNFESLSHQSGNVFYLFMVKCPLVATIVKQPIGTQVLVKNINRNNSLVF